MLVRLTRNEKNNNQSDWNCTKLSDDGFSISQEHNGDG